MSGRPGSVPGAGTLRVAGLDGRDPDLDHKLAGLQERLAPGGRFVVERPRHRRRLVRRMRHYFEGGAPRPGERFYPVQAHHIDGAWCIEAYRRGPGLEAGHFDNLGADYADEIPPHLVDHYLDKKVRDIAAAVPEDAHRILDLGCGMGEYARAVAAAVDVPVVAVDASPGSLRAAADRGGRGVTFAHADGVRLPFADGVFDAAYTINMLHHLKRGEQEAALRELHRVLAPGGVLVVCEINTHNPLFALYMRHIFPRTRRIDRGDEEFLRARRLPLDTPFAVRDVRHGTFVPDFLPRSMMRPLRGVERLLERTPLATLGIHYTAVLQKEVAA